MTVPPTLLAAATGLGTAATTATLPGLVTGATLIVSVKAAAESGSTIGNPVITDTIGTLTYDDTPAGLTSTIEKDANVSDSTRQCLTAIYTATVGADLTGTVTATVSNADVVRVAVYQIDETVTFLATARDDGALPLAPDIGSAPELDDVVFGCFAQHEYVIPSSVLADTGTSTVDSGSAGDGTTTGVSVSLRWLDVIRVDSTDDTLDWFYDSGGGWCHAASVLSYRSTAAPDPPVEDESGVGTRIELAYGGGPFTEAADLTWTDETENLDGRDVVTWRRGDDAPFPAPQPGEASFSLISTTRRYDSAHATGPLYGQLLPRVPCRITRYLAGIPYRRFFGFVRAFPLEDADAGASGQVTRIEADDAFTILQTIAAPRSEHELRVLQDDPLGYWPLDDSEGGYTRDTGRFDFFGELPHGLTSSPVAEFGGDGGVVGAYADSALAGVAGTATHTHPDGDVDIAAIEFIADMGVNEFPDYSGSGTESYTTRVVQIQSGLASWVARIVRTYSEAPLTGHFAEVTRLQMYWADGSTTRAAENIEIGRIPFFDVATQSASLDRLKSTAAGREAVRAWKAFRESERITRNLEVWAWVEASTGRDASGTLDLARQQKRTTEQAHRDAAAAIKQAQAARILAVSNTAALANLDVARDDTSRPVHIVGRVTSGPTLQVWVDGELVASSTTTGDPGGAGVLSNSVRIRLAPRGVPVGHVAAYDHDLDPQSILEHYVSARAGIGPQRTGERARMVLAAAHWPTSFSDVDNGHSYITGPPTGSTLSYLQQLAEAEQTRIFVAGDGKVTFRGRMWDVTATEATVAQATLVGHEGDPAERFAAVHRSPASAETIINDVMVVRDGGIAQRRTIPITQRQGGTFTRGYAGLPLNSDAAAGYFAAYIVDRYSTPQDRIDQLVIDAAFDSAYWLPIVSTLDLGHRVLAELHPQQVGAVLEQDATIEAVEEQFTLDGSLHTVALHLVPAQESAIDAPWALVGTTLFDGETPIHF